MHFSLGVGVRRSSKAFLKGSKGAGDWKIVLPERAIT